MEKGMSSCLKVSLVPSATMWPRLMIIARSQECSISGRMWLDISMVTSPLRLEMSSLIPRSWCGSRPMVGSSIIIMLGFARRQSAMPTR